jgi:16S rRNA (guanine1516-N2)-methyltransferase
LRCSIAETDDRRASAPNPPRVSLTVSPANADAAVLARARALAQRLRLPLRSAPPPISGRACDDLSLAVTPERLELRSGAGGRLGPIYVDFVGGALGFERRRNPAGLLYRAIAPRGGRLSVIDATAGLGRDAFRLARHGHQVTALERNPVLVALLEDGLERALRLPELAEVFARFRLVAGEAGQVLANLPEAERPDVIYLDPMFPPQQKAALVKKEMRVLRRLVGDDPDAGALLDLARRAARQRVVVKRMRLAPPLGDGAARSYADKTTRYDVYEPERS